MNKTTDDMKREYFESVDELPNHFQLHLIHAAEIMGYKHPVSTVREFWYGFYTDAVKSMHLYPETEEQLDKRLSDNIANWKDREIDCIKNVKN